MRKFISILIAVMMVLTLLPVGRVMAEDEDVTKKDETVTGAQEEGTTASGDGSGTKDDSTEVNEKLKAARDKAIEEINKLTDLSETEQNDFIQKVNEADSEDAIAQIVTAAENKAKANKAENDKKAKEANLEKAKTSLQEKIKEATDAKNTVKYTKASEKYKIAFNKALEDAEKALKNGDATADELTKAETALKAALNDLDGEEDKLTK